MEFTRIWGIDCGQPSFVTSIQVQSGEFNIYKFENDAKEFHNFFNFSSGNMIIMEKIQVLPNDLKNGRLYRSIKLFENYYTYKSVFKINDTPHVEILPLNWMRQVGQYEKGLAREERKRKHRDIARKYIADEKRKKLITIENADSFLLAILGYRNIRSNNINWFKENGYTGK